MIENYLLLSTIMLVSFVVLARKRASYVGKSDLLYFDENGFVTKEFFVTRFGLGQVTLPAPFLVLLIATIGYSVIFTPLLSLGLCALAVAVFFGTRLFTLRWSTKDEKLGGIARYFVHQFSVQYIAVFAFVNIVLLVIGNFPIYF